MFNNHHPRFILGTHPQRHIMTVEYFFANFMIRPLNTNCNIPKSMSLKGVDSAAADCAKTEDDYFPLVAIMPVNPFQLQRMDHRTVTGHLIIFIKSMSPYLAIRPPNKHIFKRNKRLFSINGYLANLFLLSAMWITPKNTAFTNFLEISKHRLGDNHRVHALQ